MFRRSLLGYRPAAVEAAIGDLESELGQRAEELRASETDVLVQDVELGVLRSRIEECEAERDGLRGELARARLRADRELRDLELIGRELEALRGTAREQATRIRMRALREAADLSGRLRFAEGEAGERERARFVAGLEAALDRVAGDWDSEPGPPPLADELDEPSSNGVTAASRRERRRVSVDIGPFADFSQLVRFEDAANSIGATGDISIKRFSAGRARIDMALSEPVDLLHELEERCDLEFKVRSKDEHEIVLDVDGS